MFENYRRPSRYPAISVSNSGATAFRGFLPYSAAVAEPIMADLQAEMARFEAELAEASANVRPLSLSTVLQRRYSWLQKQTSYLEQMHLVKEAEEGPFHTAF